MRSRIALMLIAPVIALLSIDYAAHAQPVFTPGNLVVFQADVASANNTTLQLLELSPTIPAQPTPISSFAVPGLFTSGSATSTGYMRNSPDGSLNFTGHTNNGGGGVNINTILPRGVGRYTASGTFSVVANYTGATGQQTRSAVTLDGVNYYIGDQSGVYINGGTTPALVSNVRGMQIVNGQSYIMQNSTTAPMASALTPALPPTSGSVTSATTGLPASNTFVDGFFLATGSQGASPDLFYATTTTGISKFSFDGSVWTARGNAGITGGEFGLAASIGTGGFNLYYTSGNGALAANNVVSAFDTGLFNANINLGSSTILFTAAAGTTIKGIAFAPTAVPEPGSVALVCAAAAGLAARRIRRKKASTAAAA